MFTTSESGGKRRWAVSDGGLPLSVTLVPCVLAENAADAIVQRRDRTRNGKNSSGGVCSANSHVAKGRRAARALPRKAEILDVEAGRSAAARTCGIEYTHTRHCWWRRQAGKGGMNYCISSCISDCKVLLATRVVMRAGQMALEMAQVGARQEQALTGRSCMQGPEPTGEQSVGGHRVKHQVAFFHMGRAQRDLL